MKVKPNENQNKMKAKEVGGNQNEKIKGKRVLGVITFVLFEICLCVITVYCGQNSFLN